MRRREFIALTVAGIAATIPGLALAQRIQVRRMGVLINLAKDDPATKMRLDALWEGLAKRGWSERSLQVDYRYDASTVEVALKLGAELLALNPDILVCATTPPTLALSMLTRATPIVFAFVTGPTLATIPAIQSYAHPGGNITGYANQADNEYAGKRIDMLRELLPQLARVAMIYNPSAASGGEARLLSDYLRLAAAQRVQLEPQPVNTPADITEAIRRVADAAAADPTLGLLILGDAYISTHRALALKELAQDRQPAIWSGAIFYPDEGGLIAYAADPMPAYRGAGEYVALVLNGASTADLPIQVLPPLLSVNLKTAKALGITIPPTMLAAADTVIE